MHVRVDVSAVTPFGKLLVNKTYNLFALYKRTSLMVHFTYCSTVTHLQ